MKFLKLPIMAILLLFIVSVQAQAAVNLIDCIDDDPNGVTLLQTTGVNIDACMAQATAQDGPIYLPKGKMLQTQTVHLKHKVHIIGEGAGGGGSGNFGNAVSEIIVSANTTGFVCHRTDTGPSGYDDTPVSTEKCDGSIFEGFSLRGSGTTGHGIWLRAAAVVRDVFVTGFGENCIQIKASINDGGDPFLYGNANQWLVDRARLSFCKNGLFVEGKDVNAGVAIAVDATQNDEWGFYEGSFLGNTYVGAHTAANGLGAYKTVDPNARNVFLGRYAEGGQASDDKKRTLVVGGLHGASVAPRPCIPDLAKPRVIDNLSDTGHSIGIKLNDGRVNCIRLGFNGTNMLDAQAEGDHPDGWAFARWRDKNKSATWEWRHGSNDARRPLALTTDLSPTSEEPYRDEAGVPIPAGQLIFLQEFWVPSTTVPGRYRKVTLQ